MRLTNQTAVRLSLPTGKDDLIVFDETLHGFGLRLRAGGKPTWIVQYRVGKKQRRVKLGPASALDADRARRAARDLLAKVHLGSDPQADKIAERVRASVTLEAVADRYLKRAEEKLRPRSFDQVRRHLKLHWAPLKGVPVHQLTRAMVAARLDDLVETSGPVSANRSRAALSALLKWAMGGGFVDSNVVLGTNKPAKESSRERVLDDSELVEVWNACRDDHYGRIVKLLILTAQRREEVGGMSRPEIDVARALWTIPGTRTKNKREHEVPLAVSALAIVREQLAANPDRDLLFGEGDGSFSGWSRAKAALDARIVAARTKAAGKRKPAGLVHWTLHDLRRTAVTRMAKLGIPPIVLGHVVNHRTTTKAGVTLAVYSQYDYEAEKRQALDMWAAHVAALVDGKESNVIAMQRGGQSRS